MKRSCRYLVTVIALALLAGCASQHDDYDDYGGYDGPRGGYHTSQNIWETHSQCVKAESVPYRRNYLTRHEKQTGMVGRSYSPDACTYGKPRPSRAMNTGQHKSPTAQRAQIAQMALGGAALGAIINHNDRGQGALVGAGVGALVGVAMQ